MRLRQRRSRELAQFVVAFGWRPDDYWALTWGERNAIIRESKRKKK